MSQISNVEELKNKLDNYQYVIGCDECGTGALAGCLVVCGLLTTPTWQVPGLNDSKQVSPKNREKVKEVLLKDDSIKHYIAQRSSQEIDEFGMGVALKSAYLEVFQNLYKPNTLIVCDGKLKFDTEFEYVSLIKADGLVPSVMAASILGKTFRDALMRDISLSYPNYDFYHNVGYSSKKHLSDISKFGLSNIHRRSYKISALK